MMADKTFNHKPLPFTANNFVVKFSNLVGYSFIFFLLGIFLLFQSFFFSFFFFYVWSVAALGILFRRIIKKRKLKIF